MTSLSHLQAKQVGFRTADSAGLITFSFVEGVAAGIEIVNLSLTFLFLV